MIPSAPIPPVHPDDLKSTWALFADARRTHGDNVGLSSELIEEACRPGADVKALFLRSVFVTALLEQGALNDWLDSGVPQPRVFEVVARHPFPNGIEAVNPEEILADLRAEISGRATS